MRNFRNNKRGALFVYLVFIMMVFVGLFFWFMFSNALQVIQENLSSFFVEGNWVSTDHYTSFVLANNFITYLFTFSFVIVLIVAGYWVYSYSQRKAEGLP